MAQFVRCMEGHAFDVARSATCPTCGSPVSKREPAAQKRKPAAANAPPRSQPDAPRKEPAATKPSLQARMSRKDAIAGIASMAVLLVMLVAAVSLIRRFLPDRPIPALIQAIGSGFHSKPPVATVDTKTAIGHKFGQTGTSNEGDPFAIKQDNPWNVSPENKPIRYQNPFAK